jgi:acetyltransferase-like isoleucine patch superfamily enzyme
METILKLPGFIYNKFLNIVLKFSLKKIGKNSRIISPLRLDGIKNIEIGDNVTIRSKAWICALPIAKTPKITIKNGVYIGHFFHCIAYDAITIEDKVLIADKVFITDNSHGYETALTPYIDQKVFSKKSVFVGRGTWIGENVSILGVNIGEQCIIGANSVVNKDIPPYSIAAGNPAKIIKTFDKEKQVWVKIGY